MAWRVGARPVLSAFVALDVLLMIYTRTAGATVNAGQPWAGQLCFTALDAWLAWRIWRGGRVAWAFLLALTIWPLLVLTAGAAWPWNLYQLGLMAFALGQLALLLSPAVRRHLRDQQPQPRRVT